MSDRNLYKERKIKKIENDIKLIESSHFSFVDRLRGDIDARVYAIEEKKTLLIRSLIIQQHVMIEDFLDSLLQIKLLRANPRTRRKSPLKAKIHFDHLFEDGAGFLSGGRAISFKKKIILLRIIGAIGKRLYGSLDTLNDLRNKCGHIWTLNTVIRRRVKRNRAKRYVLEFEGKNLYSTNIFIAFLERYDRVFLSIANRF